MVSYQFSLKSLRQVIPLLGIFALILLFLKLPETPNGYGLFKCTICPAQTPYLPLIGSAYFATLITISLFFSRFPGKRGGQIGLIWSILLALTLVYIDFPQRCTLCISCHTLHIFMWIVWCIAPVIPDEVSSVRIKERIFLILLAPFTIVALFSSLNLTFKVYRNSEAVSSSEPPLKVGEKVPSLTLQTLNGDLIDTERLSEGIILNFIAPQCPFCKEQLESLSSIVSSLDQRSYRWMNVSRVAPIDFADKLFKADWIEDREEKLLSLFHVEGYPTLYIIHLDGTLNKIIIGVPDQLKEDILTSL